MIVGGKITKVEAEKYKEEIHKGLNVNIGIEGVEDKEYVEISYYYTVEYKDNVGKIMIKGVLFLQEDKKTREKIVDKWKKEKKLPEDMVESVLNALNYSGSYNATMVAKVLNLGAPFVPPRISLSKK
ncbi:MAG: hypothetical protein QW035_01870 [Candidatus Anstonellales archaeon]